MSSRRLLLELFEAALLAVDGRAQTAQALRQTTLPDSVAVFSVGKASSAMMRGAFDVLGARICHALLVTKDGHLDPEIARDSRVTSIESAHPVPDARSLLAGAELRSRILALPPEISPLFLISGGASSLVEVLRPDVTLDDLRALNTRGLGAGWDIATLNEERARLSQAKRGGVARWLANRPATALFISDVPGDDPDVIGSGLLGRAAGGADRIARRIVANVDMAVHSVCEMAATHGLHFEAIEPRFDADATVVAEDLVTRLRHSDADGVVWGGESTVQLPDEHGSGGRNTHLALTAARLLRAAEPLLILAAGTDGTDGPTSDAGAIVDSGTIGRAEIGGCDVARAHLQFDSGTALEASGDLIHTGPTGTNVGDLLIALTRRGVARGYPSTRVL